MDDRASASAPTMKSRPRLDQWLVQHLDLLVGDRGFQQRILDGNGRRRHCPIGPPPSPLEILLSRSPSITEPPNDPPERAEARGVEASTPKRHSDAGPVNSPYLFSNETPQGAKD